jgi:hypothetical protein
VTPEPPVIVDAELVTPPEPDRLSHLAAQRGLIVRRALLASAVRGFLPVPIVDDALAKRIRAGLYQKLAAGRQVDLPPASAVILAGSASEGAITSMTLTAAVAVVSKIAKFAGRKFLALLAAGRGADEMARIFVKATLLDHYCAKLHVGGPITPTQATRLAAVLGQDENGCGPILDAFRDGARVLGRSLLEAPRWLSQNLSSLGERFVRSGGNPDVLDSTPLPSEGQGSMWIDRAARAVEDGITRHGNAMLLRIVNDFEQRWRQSQG